MEYNGIDAYDERGRTRLMNAAENGDVLEVRSLLEQGANPYITDRDFGTSTAESYVARMLKKNGPNSVYADILSILRSVSGQHHTNNRKSHTENKTVVPCPNCSQRLSVPLGVQGNVTCPSCGFQFPMGNNNNHSRENGDQKDYRQTTPEATKDILWCFDVLGVDKAVVGAEIKKAYKKRISEYHPDKVNNLGVELKEVAERKSKELNEAYRFLKKSELVK